MQSGDLEQQPGRTVMESFENQVNQVLNKARDDAGNMAQVGARAQGPTDLWRPGRAGRWRLLLWKRRRATGCSMLAWDARNGGG